MILRYFYDERLAQASYLLGCAATHEALIVDPAREIAPYLEEARALGLEISHITETHIHADFVSGSRELAAVTGARVYLSREGGADWQYAWKNKANVTLVGEGDVIQVGKVRLDVLHTSGHTPEHISFLVTDGAATEKRGVEAPIGIFSGDFLFAGDVGRPDLLEHAAGIVGSKEVGARAQFRSVQLVKHLPDFVQVWPGHGAGSACGKALGAVPSTTIGYERLFNPAFQFEEEQAFVDWLLADQPDAPRYFAQMKRVNREGPVLLATLESPHVTTTEAIWNQAGEMGQIFDLRARSEFAAGHLPGAINIPAIGSSWLTWLGWFVDYNQTANFVVAQEQVAGEGARELLAAMRSIGVDHIGVCAIYKGGGVEANLPVLERAEVEEQVQAGDALLLDVRNIPEAAETPDPLARNIPLARLAAAIPELDRGRRVITRCASGYRAAIAASVLERAGFRDVAIMRQE